VPLRRSGVVSLCGISDAGLPKCDIGSTSEEKGHRRVFGMLDTAVGVEASNPDLGLSAECVRDDIGSDCPNDASGCTLTPVGDDAEVLPDTEADSSSEGWGLSDQGGGCCC